MLLGAEIAITIFGLLYLVRGKGVGKTAVAHPQYRWLGGAMLTLFPAVFITMAVAIIVLLVTNPNVSPSELQDEYRWTFIGIEAGVILLYVIVAATWESRIRKKVVAHSRTCELAITSPPSPPSSDVASRSGGWPA